jgi:hypothetical protein
MHWIFSLYVAFLFFILTPAILVRLPPKAGKFTVAGFHAVVFALILHFTGKTVHNFSKSIEGFQEGVGTGRAAPMTACTAGNSCGNFTDLSGNPYPSGTNATTVTKGIARMTGSDTSKFTSYCSGSGGSYNSSAKTCTFN